MCERKLEIQDGSSETGNNYILACMQHRCTILTATVSNTHVLEVSEFYVAFFFIV